MTSACSLAKATNRYSSASAAEERRGFTLLEAVVAMAIIGVISVGALAAFSADLRAADRAHRILPAAALAQERLATLEIKEPTMLDVLPDSLTRGRFDVPFEDYSWTAVVKRVRATPRLITLSVAVSWENGSFTLSEQRYAP